MSLSLSEKKPIVADVIVKYFFPVTAGIETNMIETYSVLARNKILDVVVHTSKDVYLKKNILADEEFIRGLTVRRYPFGRFGFFPKISWDTTDIVCLHNFDIFPHLRLLIFVFFLRIIGRKSFAVFLTPHGGFNPEWSIFPRWQALLKKWYHFTLGVWLINRTVDGVRAVSEWEKAEMIRFGIRKDIIRVISNGLEDEAFGDVDGNASESIRQKVASWGKYIVQVGRIYKIKNYETVIRALPNVPSDVKFVIIGPEVTHEYRSCLEELACSLGVGDRLIFAGVLQGFDKYYAIRHAKMMVHMALWESFCNVVHEGLSQGLVCIVANNTALPFLIRDGKNGFVLPTMDNEALAAKISFVLSHEDSKEIQEIRRCNLDFGRDASWEETARKMGEFYRWGFSNTQSKRRSL